MGATIHCQEVLTSSLLGDAFFGGSKERHSCRPKVGSISTTRPTATCSPEHTLLEASKLLQSTGRTAAVILDGEQSVLGVLTENDMLSPVIWELVSLHGAFMPFPHVWVGLDLLIVCYPEGGSTWLALVTQSHETSKQSEVGFCWGHQFHLYSEPVDSWRRGRALQLRVSLF